MDIRKAIRHLNVELRTLNQAIGALEDSLERALTAKHEQHLRKMAQQAGNAPDAAPPAFESIRLLNPHQQRLELLRSSEWNVWLH